MTVPEPVRFNLWKHHAGAIRQQIRRAAGSPDAVAALPTDLLVIGADLMDLYYGERTPAELCDWVMGELRGLGVDREAAFRGWVEAGGGYRVLALPEDGSRWALRAAADADRYVHLHPGRWSPLTARVRANVLKTAIMTLAHAGLHGGDPFDVALVNHVRAAHLGLAPVRQVSRDDGLGLALKLLLG